MTDGRQIFVEVLGAAYDSQAEHFLRGDVDVDAAAIGHEAMIVKDRVRMYFGPFPTFLRIPLNFVYRAGYGKWSRISGFCAGVIALLAFAGLLGTALRSSPLSSRVATGRGTRALSVSRSVHRCSYCWEIFPSTTKRLSGDWRGRLPRSFSLSLARGRRWHLDSIAARVLALRCRSSILPSYLRRAFHTDRTTSCSTNKRRESNNQFDGSPSPAQRPPWFSTLG